MNKTYPYIVLWKINGQWRTEFYGSHNQAAQHVIDVESAARICGVEIEEITVAKELSDGES